MFGTSHAVLPLTAAQTGVWYSRLLGSATSMNITEYEDIRGPLDGELFASAVHRAVTEMDNFRTRFGEHEDRIEQVVMPAPSAPGSVLAIVDCTDQRDPEAAALALMRADLASPFDLSHGLPARFTLFRIAPDRFFWYKASHHVAGDGYTSMLFTQRVAEIYTGLATGTAYERRGFAPLADLVEADAEYRSSEQFAADREYWASVMRSRPAPVTLSRRTAAPSGRLLRCTALLEPATTAVLKEMSRGCRAAWPAAVMAATAAYLSRLTGSEDLVLGLPVTARSGQRMRDTPGMASNVVPLRLTVSPGMTVRELLRHVSQRMRLALKHQRYRYEDIRRDLGLAAAEQLFRVRINIMSFYSEQDFGGSPGSTHTLSTGPVDDLAIMVQPTAADGLRVILDADENLYDSGEAAARLSNFLTLLEDLATGDPGRPLGRLTLLTPDERREALGAVPAAPVPEVPEATLPELFRQRVRETPDATAVTFEGTSVDYAELDGRANRLARLLIERGAGPERLVAVALPRSADLVCALLAVLKSGSAYLPVDPEYPSARIAFLLADAQPALLLTRTGLVADEVGDTVDRVLLDTTEVRQDLAARASSDLTDADRTGPSLPDHPAYVIYTSGSTGTPKGVVVPHRNVVRLFTATRRWFGFGPRDVWTLFHSYAFDFSVWEIWGALLHGGRLVVVPFAVSRSPRELLGLLARESVTVLNQTPSAFHQLMEAERDDPEAARGLALRTVVFGGEALDPARLRPWYARHAADAPALVNMYGITETTVHVTHHPLDADVAAEGAGVIGHAIPDLRVHVLDGALQPLPRGVVGELYVSGPGLARGYLNRPALTAGRFVADPSGPAGTRMYRTGDLARRRADGTLEFAGRADDQVKIRGFRIELAEVEGAFLAQPGVTAAAVTVREDEHGHPGLVAYVVDGGEAAPEERRRAVAGVLPDHMVPGAVVALDALPLTANGKLDRRALPAPPRPVAAGGRRPHTQQEEILCGLFAEVLGVPEVGVEDSFFDLGGHSLLATRLISRVRSVFGSELPIRVLFEQRTVAGVAAHLGGEGVARPAVTATARPDRPPLSFAQWRLWFLHRLEGMSGTYNIPIALDLSGPLDRAALRAALTDLVHRHEALRTVFPDVDGRPYQRVLAAADTTVALAEEHTHEADLPGRLRAAAGAGFALDTELPLRAHLFATGSDRHVLLVVVHHIAGDAWSLGPLARDVATAYEARCRGGSPRWTPLPVQYADYADWQRRLLGDEQDPDSLAARQLAYWTRQLAGLPEQLPLPLDRPRPSAVRYDGDEVAFHIPPDLTAGLAALALDRHVSVFMVFQAALAVLLHRLGGGTDIVVGTPIAGRTDEALEDLVGFFVNTLVLRTDLTGDPSFAELLGRVRETSLAAYAHQDLPFERLVDALSPARSMAHHPLFQVMLSVNDDGHREAVDALTRLPGLTTSVRPVSTATAKFDLSWTFTPRYGPDGAAEGIDASVEYATALFDRATAQGFADRFVRVLQAVTAAPERPVRDVGVLSAEERRELRAAADGPVRALPRGTVAELFAAQAARTPDSPAVIVGPEALDYAELDARANRLARLLAERGVAAERRVAVALPPSADLVVAELAVLKAGGAFVPVDTDYPAERVRLMLDDSAPVLVLTTAEREPALPGTAPALLLDSAAVRADLAGRPSGSLADHELTVVPDPEHPAYVIYTSGSTGVPKGVVVTHRGVPAMVAEQRECFEVGPGSRILQFASPSFDASVWETATALLTGATLVVPRPEEREPGAPLARLIEDRRVTHALLPPSALAALETGSLPAGLTLTVGGEACPADLVARWSSEVRMINAYGPTESTVYATLSAPLTGASVPLGGPITGTRVYVLDSALCPVPPGVPGEICIAGAGLARGYLNRPGLTAERFVADPFGPPGTRMYRSGDLARRTAGGELEYLGRADHQVKVRGFRIELGEIEAALLRRPEIAQAAVTVHEDPTGHRRLAAYVVAHAQGGVAYAHEGAASGSAETADPSGPGPANTSTCDPAAVREALRRELPDYMVPAAVVVLDALPLTPNGKIDRRALPAPDFGAASQGPAARTASEEALSALFAETLGIPEPGVDSGFFALGGDSVLAIQLVSRARAAGIELSARDVFQHQTVRALAEVAGSDSPSRPDAATSGTEPADDGTGPVDATPTTEWLRSQGGPIGGFGQAALLTVAPGPDPALLADAVQDLLDHHDALRLRLTRRAGAWDLHVRPRGSLAAADLVTRVAVADPAALAELVAEHAAAARGRLDPDAGTMVQVVWFDAGDAPGRLLLMLHHLVVDGVSWRILLPDLHAAWTARTGGGKPSLAPVGTSYRTWARRLNERAAEPSLAAELPHWTAVVAPPAPLLHDAVPDPERDRHGSAGTLEVTLPAEDSEALLHTVPARFHTTVADALLTALALSVTAWCGRRGRGGDGVLVDVETHGRAEHGGADLSRTVGWFTGMYPVRLDPGEVRWNEIGDADRAVGRALKAVKEQLRATPGDGLGHGLLRWLAGSAGTALAAGERAAVLFNYLGRLDTAGGAWTVAPESALVPQGADPGMPLSHPVAVDASVVDGPGGLRLTARWTWAPRLFSRAEAEELAGLWREALGALVRHADRPDSGGHTPSDVPLVDLTQQDIDDLEADLATEWSENE